MTHDALEWTGPSLLQLLVERAPIGCAVIGADLRYVHVNAELAAMHGLPAAEHVGRPIDDIVPDVWPKIESQYRAVLAGEGERSFVVSGSVRPDGSTPRVLEVRLVPLTTEDNRIAIGCFVLDITERERVRDEEWRQRQKMGALGQLSSGIAHDFANLLTVMGSCSELLLDMLPEGSLERELCEEIHQASERGGMLTRQLLGYSRNEIVAPRVIDLNDLLDEHEPLLRRLIGDDILLTVRLERPLWPILADRGLIAQLVMNLAVNARDAMPSGGRLVITTSTVSRSEPDAARDPRIPPGDWIVLTVRDSGTGIEAEIRDRIFDPFFTTKPAGKGTGIGLATVRWAAEESNGFVMVDSEPSHGATFHVYFPRVASTAEHLPRHVSHAPIARGSETLLVVEDEVNVRSLARRVLDACGYTVLEASDGREAIDVAMRHAGPIPLVISDVVMPHLGGHAFAEALHAVHPESRVLFMSGYDGDEVLRHGISTAADELLAKPFTPAMLAQRVRDALDASPPSPLPKPQAVRDPDAGPEPDRTISTLGP